MNIKNGLYSQRLIKINYRNSINMRLQKHSGDFVALEF